MRLRSTTHTAFEVDQGPELLRNQPVGQRDDQGHSSTIWRVREVLRRSLEGTKFSERSMRMLKSTIHGLSTSNGHHILDIAQWRFSHNTALLGSDFPPKVLSGLTKTLACGHSGLTLRPNRRLTKHCTSRSPSSLSMENILLII